MDNFYFRDYHFLTLQFVSKSGCLGDLEFSHSQIMYQEMTELLDVGALKKRKNNQTNWHLLSPPHPSSCVAQDVIS